MYMIAEDTAFDRETTDYFTITTTESGEYTIRYNNEETKLREIKNRPWRWSLEYLLGGVFGWEFLLGEWYWRLIYWRQRICKVLKRQARRLKRMGYWSGFMSQARGLVWDRRSRYGKK